MLGLDVLREIYIDKSVPAGTVVLCEKKQYVVENQPFGLREKSSDPAKRGRMVHNYSFEELLDFR